MSRNISPAPDLPVRVELIGGPCHEQRFHRADAPEELIEEGCDQFRGGVNYDWKYRYVRITQLRDGIWLYSWRP